MVVFSRINLQLRPGYAVLAFFIAMFFGLAHPTQASITEQDILSVYGESVMFDPTDVQCAGTSVGSGSSTGYTGGTYVNWNSGLEPPYIMEQFVIEVLKYIADFTETPREDVVTQEHTLALLAWAWGEGGDINNSSVFNLFNTSALRDDPDARPYAAGGSDGRQAYVSFDVGIKATGGNILGGTSSEPDRYSRIVTAVTNKDTTASDVLYAYTHYSEYPGNNWWAQQNEIDGEDAYYNKMIGQLNGFINDYSRAATVIGTPEKEQQVGLKDTSKLTYSGEGVAAAVSSGTASAGSVCPTQQNSNAVVAIAEAEFVAGASESDETYLKYTEGNEEAWCGWFMSWVFREAGDPFSGGEGEDGYAYRSVSAIRAMAEENNWYHDKSEVTDGSFTPQPGDIAIYTEGSEPYPEHVNIVISYSASTQTYIAIGGNEGNAVQKNEHQISSSALSGFMRKGN